MEDNHIGLQFAGRNPGFKAFMSLNWMGDQLPDVNYNGDEPYVYSVKIDALYETYTLVLLKVFSNGREANAFLSIRFRSGYVIVDRDANPVSPVVLLDRFRDIVLSKYYHAIGDGSYDLLPDPIFDRNDLQSVITGYYLEKRWGSSIRMSSAETGQREFITTDGMSPADIIKALPLCKEYEGVSELVVCSSAPRGRSQSFALHNLSRKPQILLSFVTPNGTKTPLKQMDEEVRVRPSDIGFNPKEFEDEVVVIRRDDILEAFRSKRQYSPGETASVVLDPVSGSVVITLSPNTNSKEYPITFTLDGKPRGHEGMLGNLVWVARDGNKIHFTEPKISFAGQNITEFENQASKEDWLTSRFKYHSDNHILENVRLIGGNIVVSLQRVKKAPARPAPGRPAAPSAGLAAPAGEVRLRYTIACKYKPSEAPVLIRIFNRQSTCKHRTDYKVKPEMQSNGFFGGEIPYINNPGDNTLTLDYPPKYKGKIMLAQDEVSFECELTRIGFVERMADLFRFKYGGANLSSKLYFSRLVAIVGTALLALLIAFGLGVFFQPQITECYYKLTGKQQPVVYTPDQVREIETGIWNQFKDSVETIVSRRQHQTADSTEVAQRETQAVQADTLNSK